MNKTRIASTLVLMLLTGGCRLLSVIKPLPSPVLGATKSEPDYSSWTSLLKKHYDPARGMNYRALKQEDRAVLEQLQQSMAKVDAGSLSRDEQLAYWINLYNINVASLIVENYPLKSIQDLSTDQKKINIFDKAFVPYGAGMISLNKIESGIVRPRFKDPRIHFALNCAAKSCPPLRTEAYTGARINMQLDEQANKFLNTPRGVKVSKQSGTTVLHATKVMEFFPKDFEKWGGGAINFIRKHADDDLGKTIDAAGKNIRIEYQDYDWSLNDRG